MIHTAISRLIVYFIDISELKENILLQEEVKAFKRRKRLLKRRIKRRLREKQRLKLVRKIPGAASLPEQRLKTKKLRNRRPTRNKIDKKHGIKM